jgi:hypothetical protein
MFLDEQADAIRPRQPEASLSSRLLPRLHYSTSLRSVRMLNDATWFGCVDAHKPGQRLSFPPGAR